MKKTSETEHPVKQTSLEELKEGLNHFVNSFQEEGNPFFLE